MKRWPPDPKAHTRLARLLVSAALSLLVLGSVSIASAAAAPLLDVQVRGNTTAAPGGPINYAAQVRNVGDEDLQGPEEFLITLPASVTATAATVDTNAVQIGAGNPITCTAPDGSSVVGASQVKCVVPGGLASERLSQTTVHRVIVDGVVGPAPPPGSLVEVAVSGANGDTATAIYPVAFTADPPRYGVAAFDNGVSAADGTPYTQAGGHPYAITTEIDFNSADNPDAPNVVKATSVEPPKDVIVDLPAGFVGDPSAFPRCTLDELLNGGPGNERPSCSPDSQLGTTTVRWATGTALAPFYGPRPVFNMEPPPGVVARFGFHVLMTPIALDVRLRDDGEYAVSVDVLNIPNVLNVAGSSVTLWGQPGSPEHLAERHCPGILYFGAAAGPPLGQSPNCASSIPEVPFLRNITSCAPQAPSWTMHTDSWLDPGTLTESGDPVLAQAAWKTSSMRSHAAPGYPYPSSEWGAAAPLDGCDLVPVKGTLSATPTSIETETPSGLAVHVKVPNPGLEIPTRISSSDIKKVRVTLPQGVTINPSQAEGLGVCSPQRYESTRLEFHPDGNHGCPSDSKVGTVEVKTPLLDETIPGEVYVAEQDDPSTPQPGAENPFDSLLAIYVVLAEPQRGILVKLPGKVETDASSGRIVTTFDDLPQQPFSTFDFRFREGARAPLVTPPSCGTYETLAEFWGHSDPDGPPVTSRSSFEIVRGIGGSPCPPDGTPGFDPGFSAGTLNNNAGSFSPTTMRLTRRDGEQDLTRFSAVLPEGLLAKLAGVEQCSDAAIAAAKGKTGRQELAGPSCPGSSKIGRTLAGAGVGSVLTYVPGSIYLAGPYKGAPLSVAAITPAVAGPFDVGTVVVRVGLSLDPVTGVASVDGAASDPIPHILEGIPLKLRDLRVYVDRSEFTLNPTSCEPDAIGATLWGSAADVFDPADDVPVGRESRFQAANCAALGFRPKLSIKLKGGTRRGRFPALRAVLRPRNADANLARTVVKLPRSAFLEQAHIRTICTRVQWNQDACPKGAVYGKVVAHTPLLEQPLRGNAYLRSSSNKLPDLVFDLKGIVDIEASARIDSVRGGIRATFPRIPDAPLTKVVVDMQGGKKGLIVNSRNLCRKQRRNRAAIQLDGHNGKVSDTRPVVRARCGGKRKAARRAALRKEHRASLRSAARPGAR